MHLMTDYTDPSITSACACEQRASLRADVRNQLVKAEASDPDQLVDITYCLLALPRPDPRVRHTQKGLSARPAIAEKCFARLRLPCVLRPNRAGSASWCRALHKKRCSL